ncbi:NAD(P)H-hydrate epimerase, partial [Dokdonella sp.]|uniref:NAD(P)H-hydrate epimerase n=1 Tax=Dokdonella sp. TaxID=2291710 RepID=UPI003C72B28D
MPRLPPATILHTVEQVRALDRAAIAGGIAGHELMARAAAAAFALLCLRWQAARRVLVVAGNGNNGGDAFLVAGLAAAAGLDVHVVALGEESSGDAARARAAWLDAGGSIAIAG